MRQSTLVKWVASLIVVAGYSFLWASEPYGFRANGQGRFPDATPVTEWGPDKNVVWKTPMPNWSNACPVLCGDRLFVCAEPTTLICVNLADGKILWQRSNDYLDVDPDAKTKMEENTKRSDEVKVRIEAKQKERAAAAEIWSKDQTPANLKKIKDLDNETNEIVKELRKFEYVLPRTDKVNGYSSATPVTDGKNVWAVFGTGVTACYDKDGKLIWRRFIEQPSLPGDYGVEGTSASPLLAGNVLLAFYEDLYGLDAATGKELWKVKTQWSFGTPVLAKIGGQDVVYTPCAAAFAVSDGKPVATDAAFGAHASSPVLQDGVLYLFNKGNGNHPSAYKLSVTSPGKLEKLWQNTSVGYEYYASPLVHEGLVYNLNIYSNALTVFDAADGKVVYERKMKEFGGGLFYSSPTLAGKYVVLMGSEGTALVLEPGREYKVVAENKLEEVRSTPIFEGSRMYVRTLKTLYCIGK